MPFEKANLQTNKSSHLFSKRVSIVSRGRRSLVSLVPGPCSPFFGFGFGFGLGCRRWYLKMAKTRGAWLRLRGLLFAGLPDRIGMGWGWDRYLCRRCTMQLLTSKVMRGEPKANTRRSNIKGQAQPCGGYRGSRMCRKASDWEKPVKGAL